jgi:hypothetical protein
LGKLSVLTIANGASSLLTAPVPAAVLGLALGVGLLAVCRFGARFFTAEEPEIGMMRTLVINAGAMAIALAALALYFVCFRPGFAAFGVGLVGGFTTMALVELFRFAGPHKAPYARR